jgi:transposase
MTTEADNPDVIDGVLDDTSGRMSARSPRIEVITHLERRRRWSWEQKRAIVKESLTPHASPTAIARKHGLNTGQLYTWRRQLLSLRPEGAAGFARVEMTRVPAQLEASSLTVSARPPGLIEIVLPSGTLVRIDSRTDERSLRRVLAVLRE